MRFEDSQSENGFKVAKIIGFAVFGLVVLITILSSFSTVEAGERGVRTRMGAITGNVVEPGLYFMIPFIDDIHIIDARTQTLGFENNDKVKNGLSSASKDLQVVTVQLVVNYHIDPAKVQDIYQKYKTVEYFNSNVLQPAIRDAAKSVSPQYTAEELITKRAEFNDDVTALVIEKAQENNAVVERVNVTDVDFSAGFNAAIEAKVTAQQNAEKAKNDLVRIQFEAEQKVATAKGDADARIATATAEAEAIRIQAQAIQSQGGAEYVNLKAVEAWNGELPTQMIPGSALPFINLNR